MIGKNINYYQGLFFPPFFQVGGLVVIDKRMKPNLVIGHIQK
jgi:hypothetical protein